MRLSSSKLKMSYISGENLKKLKIKQKILLRVVSYDVFLIFATVEHRQIPFEASVIKINL